MAVHLMNTSLTLIHPLKCDFLKQVPPPRRVRTTPADARWVSCSFSSTEFPMPAPNYQRRSANYKPTTWTHKFLQSIKIDHTDEEYEKLKAKKLKEEVRDVFKYFMDDNGHFKRYIQNDIKGMLSLYEAAYLALEGEEDLLDKALVFTSEHLRDFQSKMEGYYGIAEHVSHSLELPVHRRMSRLEARWFIEALDKSNYINSKLLELAKLDFNLVQSVHQRDLGDMSMWWNNLGLSNKLSFARDRLMECFFWTVGMVFQPQFSHCRKGLTKVTYFITIIDDIYDVYGTLDELEQFTNLVERWDIDGVADLPDYMRLCFLALYNTINEMAYDTLKERGENIIPYLTKAWADICKAFLQEAKWSCGKCIPTFEEYLENGWRSVSGVVILTHTYFLLGQTISKQPLDCLKDCHQLLRSSSIIFRLCNDLGTSSAEILRGESANSITCYMNETRCSEEVARAHCISLIGKAWKELNRILVDDDSPFDEFFVETAINLARMAQCTYQYGDAHGAPDATSKNRVRSLIIEPISLA
ncbi:probable terpene synthase 12 isoform X2 [Tripterygium wilfordii]|uniref:probable terpene synthase 12 isoform X2 n=1 Tax=Tripterygium wilfordii TaxID=458696 RepID=UPI0018F83913|nr:probable terpene synthase 12 isoform X2 [Tripterygium wilfordii]